MKPMEPFVVKHYISDDRPSIKGNGFDGLEIGENREEAERFVEFINSVMLAAAQAEAWEAPNTEALAALMKLADEFASCEAKTQLESLYGTSRSYTNQCREQEAQARHILEGELRRLAAVEAERDELREHLQFIERWANHHGQKPHTTPAEILSVIQHYPPIKAITRSYADGKVPDTPNPWAERDALVAAQLAHKASAWREGFELGRIYGIESERFDSQQSRPDVYPERPANPYEQ